MEQRKDGAAGAAKDGAAAAGVEDGAGGTLRRRDFWKGVSGTAAARYCTWWPDTKSGTVWRTRLGICAGQAGEGRESCADVQIVQRAEGVLSLAAGVIMMRLAGLFSKSRPGCEGAR